MTQRLCYECKLMRIHSAEAGYSEWTPGIDMGMYCNANRWNVDRWTISREKFRRFLAMARTCPDYEADPEMIAIGIRGSPL